MFAYWLFYFIILLFGLTVGSFLNCIIYRIEIDSPRPNTLGRGSRSAQSFLSGRSFCPNCKHILNWQDLIPIFSFLILKGRCRYCQKKISWQYPIVEISTGLIFLLISNFQFLILKQFLIGGEDFVLFFTFASTNGSSVFNFLNLIYYWIIASFLIIIFVYDLKHYIIPDKIIYPAILIAGIFNFQFLISKQFLIFNYLILSAILAAAFFLVIVLISRGKWMGVGDIKLAFLMGLFLGWPNILFALFSAFFIGAIIGIGLIMSGKRTLKSEIPFGPFLIAGTFLALFFGEKIINWYLRFI